MESFEARRSKKFSSKSGWWMKVYQGPNDMKVMPPTLAGFKLLGKRIVQEVDLQNIEAFKAKVAATPNENFVWVFAGTLRIDKEGDYDVCTKSDDGSKLFMHGELLVDNDGLHGPEQKCKKIKLTAGKHRVTAVGFQHGGGAFMQVTYKGADTGGTEKVMRSATRRYSTVFSGGRGWVMKIMRGPADMSKIPKFAGLKKLGTSVVNKIDFQSDGEFRRYVVKTPGENYVWLFGGMLRVKTPGVYYVHFYVHV
jgi:hypothetical protein